MRRIGRQVWWSVADAFETDSLKLESMGFGKFAPKNAPRAALLKAIKIIKKRLGLQAEGSVPKLRADHERFIDDADKCSIAITRPRVVNEELDGYDIICTCKIDKNTGNLELEHGPNFFDADELKREYLKQRNVVTGQQFSQIVKLIVIGNDSNHFSPVCCHGVSMRPYSGGLYFVDERYQDRLNKVRELFLAHTDCRFDATPLYDEDMESVDAVDFAASTELRNHVERFTARLKTEGALGLTERELNGKKKKAAELIARIKIHAERATSAAAEVTAKADMLTSILNTRVADAESKKVAPFNLDTAMNDWIKGDTAKPSLDAAIARSRENAGSVATEAPEVESEPTDDKNDDPWDF